MDFKAIAMRRAQLFSGNAPTGRIFAHDGTVITTVVVDPPRGRPINWRMEQHRQAEFNKTLAVNKGTLHPNWGELLGDGWFVNRHVQNDSPIIGRCHLEYYGIIHYDQLAEGWAWIDRDITKFKPLPGCVARPHK